MYRPAGFLVVRPPTYTEGRANARKTILIDFNNDGVRRTMEFVGRADFAAFLVSQGVGGVERVGSNNLIRNFEKLVEGATYSFVTAGERVRGDATRLQAKVASATKALIDSVSRARGDQRTCENRICVIYPTSTPTPPVCSAPM